MVVVLFQTVACCGAGALLYWLWRHYVSPMGIGGLIVTVGFLARALAGQFLFWVSYLELPIARSLQAGSGLWVFALDAQGYMGFAVAAADGNMHQIFLHRPPLPSLPYVQILAIFVWLFGSVAATGLLLNLFAYLGMAIVVLRWGRSLSRDPGRLNEGLNPGVLALVALSFSPSALLWSLQPLKDTCFQLLLVGWLAIALAWWREWSRVVPRVPILLASGGGLLALLFFIGGVRWYFACVLLVTSFFFFIIISLRVRGHRLACVGASILVLLLMMPVVRFSSGPEFPAAIRDRISPVGAIQVLRNPGVLRKAAEDSRRRFESIGGSTIIGDPRSLADATSSTSSTTGLAKGLSGDAVVRLPKTHEARLRTGVAATLVPIVVAERFHLIDVKGGRGMLWFADVDTLVFAALLVIVVVFCLRRLRSASWRNASFWLVLLTTLFVAVPMIYSVSNFGSLFRLRVMIFTGLALVPLALVSGPLRHSPAEENE